VKEKKLKIGEYSAKFGKVVSCTLRAWRVPHCSKTIKKVQNNPNIHRFKKITGRLSDKPFLIWLVTIPPHLKYVTAVPRNLSLITALLCDCRLFSDINVSH